MRDHHVRDRRVLPWRKQRLGHAAADDERPPLGVGQALVLQFVREALADGHYYVADDELADPTSFMFGAVNNQGVLRVGTVGTLELPGGLNNSGAYVITRPTAPELNFQRVGGAGRLTFLAEAGVDYHVTSRLALPPGSWTAVQTVPGQGSTEQIPFSLTADQRFFRVEVLP